MFPNSDALVFVQHSLTGQMPFLLPAKASKHTQQNFFLNHVSDTIKIY